MSSVALQKPSTAEKALKFVEKAKLPPAPKKAKGKKAKAATVAEFDFDKHKNEALVVGSDIISFVKGVTEQRREDIVNSALLAQLIANAAVPDKTHVFAWYDKYFDALTQIGWVVQDRQFIEHVEHGSSLEVHKAIIKLATAVLGPGATALVVVEETLNALQSMDENSPWITLFSQQSQAAKTARFQVTLAEQAPDGQFLVTLLAFGLSAAKRVTQVLFFKFGKSDVQLKHSSGKVTINETVLNHIRDTVNERLAEYADAFIKKLPDLG
jgi:hypothetical protein